MPERLIYDSAIRLHSAQWVIDAKSSARIQGEQMLCKSLSLAANSHDYIVTGLNSINKLLNQARVMLAIRV